MAAQRLRKTFKYPSESDDEDAVEAGMDEQGKPTSRYHIVHFPPPNRKEESQLTNNSNTDQAELISSLTTHDTSSTRTYTLLLLILPLAPISLYIPSLLSSSTALPSLLAIASLLASAYTLYFLPLPPQQVSIIDTRRESKKPGAKLGSYSFSAPRDSQVAGSHQRPEVPYISSEVADWLAAYLTKGNIVVAGCLAVHEACWGSEWGHRFMIEGGYLPVLICFVVLWARRELRVIDMSGLERLKGMGTREGGKML